MNKPSFLYIFYSLPLIFLLCATIGINACTPIENLISTPTSTPTEKDMVIATMGREFIQVPFKDDWEECKDAVEKGELDICVGLFSIERFTHPELEKLFFDTHFYLIRNVAYNKKREYPSKGFVHLAWQNGQLYTADTFDDLLALNSIKVTDENRELVAKTFALMTLTDHLKDEVVFTGWEEVNYQPGEKRHPYDHCLTAWTKIQGFELRWCFIFKDDYLSIATGISATDSEVGDYIEPDYEIPRVRFNDYCFEDYCS